MKTIQILSTGAALLITVTAVQASPWDFFSRPAPRPPQHHHHHDDHRRPGYQSNRIEARAQVRLRQLGYYRGPIDGQFGRGSRYALIRFQHDRRLPETGRLDHRTVRALRL